MLFDLNGRPFCKPSELQRINFSKSRKASHEPSEGKSIEQPADTLQNARLPHRREKPQAQNPKNGHNAPRIDERHHPRHYPPTHNGTTARGRQGAPARPTSKAGSWPIPGSAGTGRLDPEDVDLGAGAAELHVDPPAGKDGRRTRPPRGTPTGEPIGKRWRIPLAVDQGTLPFWVCESFCRRLKWSSRFRSVLYYFFRMSMRI